MSDFTVDSLRPIGGHFWKAEISVAGKEEIEGRAFGSTLTITFRFKFHHEGSVRELLRHALDEARRHHSIASDTLQSAVPSEESRDI